MIKASSHNCNTQIFSPAFMFQPSPAPPRWSRSRDRSELLQTQHFDLNLELNVARLWDVLVTLGSDRSIDLNPLSYRYLHLWKIREEIINGGGWDQWFSASWRLLSWKFFFFMAMFCQLQLAESTRPPPPESSRSQDTMVAQKSGPWWC